METLFRGHLGSLAFAKLRANEAAKSKNFRHVVIMAIVTNCFQLRKQRVLLCLPGGRPIQLPNANFTKARVAFPAANDDVMPRKVWLGIKEFFVFFLPPPW